MPHTRNCPTTCVREETVEERVLHTLLPLQFSEEERMYLGQKIIQLRLDWNKQKDDYAGALQLRLGQLQDRLAHLTDA